MKKIKLLIISIILICTCGCSLLKDSLENGTIYATIYPIKYLTEYLYKDYGDIKSIYPNGADINNYQLTEKQIKEYSKASLFIYNGLSNEKNTAKTLLNKNRNLLIIDVSNGLSTPVDMKELWMSPNNYLMLAKNIKTSLKDYLTNKTIITYVDKKYDELAEKLSLMDAELRSIGKDATNKETNTLVVNDDALKFLENYGFNIVSLDNDSLTEANYTNIKNSFSNKKYTKVFMLDNNKNDKITELEKEYKITLIDIKSLTLLESNESIDYLENMQAMIDSIRDVCLN